MAKRAKPAWGSLGVVCIRGAEQTDDQRDESDAGRGRERVDVDVERAAENAEATHDQPERDRHDRRYHEPGRINRQALERGAVDTLLPKQLACGLSGCERRRDQRASAEYAGRPPKQQKDGERQQAECDDQQ